MRRIQALLPTAILLLTVAAPALADEGDPLAEAVLLPGWLGAALAGLALFLFFLFAILARR